MLGKDIDKNLEIMLGKEIDKSKWMTPEGYAAITYEGCVYPPYMIPELIDDLRKTPLVEGDILIATFPKCGTTLMQQIILTLLADGDSSKVKDPMEFSKWAEWSVSFGKSLDAFTKWVPDEQT